MLFLGSRLMILSENEYDVVLYHVTFIYFCCFSRFYASVFTWFDNESPPSVTPTGKQLMHDPMAMRPFMGYNFGDYLQHWLDMKQPGRRMPQIFHVNWFRLNERGKFLWPGFGDNIRVIDWILRRVDGEAICEPSAVGNIPKKGSINLEGLGDVDWDQLCSLPKEYWQEDARETQRFFDEQVGCDLPRTIQKELNDQAERINNML